VDEILQDDETEASIKETMRLWKEVCGPFDNYRKMWLFFLPKRYLPPNFEFFGKFGLTFLGVLNK
jgi:hypothetical protein